MGFRHPFEGLTGAALARAQFSQRPGTELDQIAHWSVWRGDPNPDQPHNLHDFQRHLRYCRLCQDIEARRRS